MVQSQDTAREESWMADGRMRIGRFAEAAGVSVDAVRFYERRGVLGPAPRTPGGYRTFDHRDLDRVRLARQLQSLGLTIDEVVDALTAHDSGGASCSSERWRLDQVEARIDAQLAQLRRTRQLIRDTLAACDAGHCQLVEQSRRAQRSSPTTRQPNPRQR
jgi:DNA-binding transcriptional MerR regulator